MVTSGLKDSPWLLLPGTLCTGAVFDLFLDALGVTSDQRIVVTLDRPAIESYRATFSDLSENTIVCGFSLGAIVAAHHAGQMRARRLILFGVNPYADDPAKAHSRKDLAMDVTTLGGAEALRMRGVDANGPRPDGTRKAIYHMAEAAAHLIDAQTQLALSRPGALPCLAEARMPVLSLTGSQDSAAPPAQGKAAAQAAPDGQFRELAGLGHFAVLEDPKACADALLDMMESHFGTA